MSIDQPAATPLKLAPPSVDRPLLAGAATDRNEKKGNKENDVVKAESITKSAIHVALIPAFRHRHEPAQVSLLSRLTKEDSDAALAVRLCTEAQPSSRELRDDICHSSGHEVEELKKEDDGSTS
jgi:hypothetical protein